MFLSLATCKTEKDTSRRLNHRTAGMYKYNYCHSNFSQKGILAGVHPCGVIALVGKLFGAESKEQVYGYLHSICQSVRHKFPQYVIQILLCTLLNLQCLNYRYNLLWWCLSSSEVCYQYSSEDTHTYSKKGGLVDRMHWGMLIHGAETIATQISYQSWKEYIHTYIHALITVSSFPLFTGK